MRRRSMLRECLSCGSRNVRWVVGPFNYVAHGKRASIPRVPRERCLDCREEFFGPEANAVLDKHRGRRRSKTVSG